MREFLDALAAFGKKTYPRVSDLEKVVGPLFVDVDDAQESSSYVRRPDGSSTGPFFYVTVEDGPKAGTLARVCARAPVSFGRSPRMRLVLTDGHRDGGVVRVAPTGAELVVTETATLVTLNGRPASGVLPLSDGDAIGCGGETLRVHRHPGWRDAAAFSDRVTWLSVSLDWDQFHEGFHQAVDRTITELLLVLRGASPDDVIAALAPHLGRPRTLANGEQALHPFYVTGRSDGTVVEWLREVPERALERVDARARADFVHDLLRTMPEMAEPESIVSWVADRRAGAGVFESRVTGSREVLLRLRPPIDARELCALAGWARATATTSDVHMSSWRIEVDGASPRCGPWIVEAYLDGWPKRIDGAERRAESVYSLDDHTSGVEHIYVRGE